MRNFLFGLIHSIHAVTIGFLILAIQPTWCLGASFDCRKATTSVEKLVCSSNEVTILDVQLYETYQRAQRLAANSNTIRNQQRRWLKETRNKCETVECLRQAYQKRISELEAEIHFDECEDVSGSTLSIGYCEGRLRDEADKTITDLTSLLSARHDAQQMNQFMQHQDEWRENVDCDCGEKVGRIMGPGDSAYYLQCARELTEQRLIEIREITAGLHSIEYGGNGPRSCVAIRAKENADPEHQMIQAITNSDIDTVKSLLKKGIKMPRGDYSYTPIDIAVRNNNPEMLSFLLANGADPKEDIVAIRASLKTCNMEMVSLLVEHGYQVKGNPNYGPYDPLPWAALFGCRDIVEYLVSKGADLKSPKPLRVAASECHV
ncbi:MAG TPA: ankyrin repeat domain-containing protein, partial [Mariprofundaceae bacterium]|nr:ankyrin repeat domain-containing protein [Mariprofundaceae bacterium]